MFRDRGCGLPNVWLESGYELHETKWGQSVSIADSDGLFRAITLELCLSNHELDGNGVRFLRKRMELTQGDLGTLLGCTGQAVAKWEKGEVASIPAAPARLLRLLVLKHIAPTLSLEQALVPYGEPVPEKLVFAHAPDGWMCAEHQHTPVKVTVTMTRSVAFADVVEAAIGMAGRFDIKGLSAFAHNDQEFERHASKLAAA